MVVDFFTSYSTIGFISMSMLLAWIVLAVSFPDIRAARYWLAGALTNVLAGTTLAAGQEPHSMMPIYVGNALVIFSFGLTWSGLRCLHGRPSRWPAMLVFALLCLAMVLLVRDDRHARQVVYAVGQSVPLTLTLFMLLRYKAVNIGSCMAIVGIAVSLMAHVWKLTVSTMLENKAIWIHHYQEIAIQSVLMMVLGGALWKVGLLVLTFERIRGGLIMKRRPQ